MRDFESNRDKSTASCGVWKLKAMDRSVCNKCGRLWQQT